MKKVVVISGGSDGLGKCLQPELAAYGIKVIGLYPSLIHTQMFEKMGIKKDMAKAIEPEGFAKSIEFILSFGPAITIPGLEIKNIQYS